MERLGSLDAVFLAIETDACPMHLGQVAVFAGPAPGVDEVRRAVAERLPRVPRCRQRVRESWHGVTRPVWVDDGDFDIQRHVLHATLPTATRDELDRFAEQVMMLHLQRDRPLWELWVIDDAGDGRWAVVGKVHHCLVDGIAGTDLLSALLAEGPAAPATAGLLEYEPSTIAVTWFGVASALRSAGARLRRLVVACAHPAACWTRAREVAEGARGLWLQPRRRGSPLTGSIGRHRRWARAGCSLDDVATIRAAHGGSVNDVVLAACALGFRALVRARRVSGRPDVMTLMPVSTRGADARGVLDNRVAVTHALLPVDTDDPVQVLDRLRTHLAEVKASHQSAASTLLLHSGDLVPNRVAAAIARGVVRAQTELETVTTNVPGPQLPLRLCGREMVEGWPFAPIAGRIRLVVAIWSYCGRLFVGVTGDGDAAADVDVLAAGIDDGFRRLVSSSR